MLKPSNIKQPTQIPAHIKITKCPPGVAAGIVPGAHSSELSPTIGDIILEKVTDTPEEKLPAPNEFRDTNVNV